MTDHTTHQAAEISIDELDQVAGGMMLDALREVYQAMANAVKAHHQISRELIPNIRG